MGAVIESFRRGYSIEDVRDLTGGITRWFLRRFEKIAAIETEIRAAGEMGMKPAGIPESEMRSWKRSRIYRPPYCRRSLRLP